MRVVRASHIFPSELKCPFSLGETSEHKIPAPMVRQPSRKQLIDMLAEIHRQLGLLLSLQLKFLVGMKAPQSVDGKVCWHR